MARDFETAMAAGQLVLFPCLAVPEALPRLKRSRHAALAVPVMVIQFAIDLRERVEVDPDEIEEDGDRFVHSVVAAAKCEPPKTRAACSIFALAAEQDARQVISEFMLWPSGEPEAPAKPERVTFARRRIVRDGDVTRHIALREQETEEWAEKERVRRAKQRPPKPQKQKFKMKGTRQWVTPG